MEALELDHAAQFGGGPPHGHAFALEAPRLGLCCVHWLARCTAALHFLSRISLHLTRRD